MSGDKWLSLALEQSKNRNVFIRMINMDLYSYARLINCTHKFCEIILLQLQH